MVARQVACNTRDVAGPVLLERERELAELAQAAREAAAGEGGLVLIFGEAGIGKSSLVRALRGLLPANGRLLVGHCDDLGTPRTLGPFRDLVGQVGAELTRALAEGGERDAMLAALPAELDWAGHPTVLVVEDVHWADEATLDVLGYLARRIAEPAGRPGPDLPRRRADPRASPAAAPRAGVGLGPGPPAAVAAPVGGRGPVVERDQPGRRRPRCSP